MKSLVSFVAAAMLAAPVLAQPVQFNIQCLPQAQQDEIKAKAQAISDAAQARQISAQSAAGSANEQAGLRAARDNTQAAMFDCIAKAQAAGKVPGDMCKDVFDAFSQASQKYEHIAAVRVEAGRKAEEENRSGLQFLRSQYPQCPTDLKPDNAVIRK